MRPHDYVCPRGVGWEPQGEVEDLELIKNEARERWVG